MSDNMRDKLPVDTAFDIPDAGPRISEAGKAAVRRMLYGHASRIDMPVRLPAGFDWSPVSKEGKFARRVSKYYYKLLKEGRITQAHMDRLADNLDTIGETFQRHVHSSEGLRMHVKRASWLENVTIGDSGSCLKGGHVLNRFDDADIVALAIEEEDGEWDGWRARCFLMPDYPRNGWAVLWNARGNEGREFFADAIAHHLGMATTRAKYTGEIGNYNTPYIDSDYMAVIHPKDVEPEKMYDMKDTMQHGTCHYCGDKITHYSRINEYGYEHHADCEDEYAYCEYCDAVLNNYNHEVWVHDNLIGCDECADYSDYFECYDCGEWEHLDNQHEHNGKDLCPPCHAEALSQEQAEAVLAETRKRPPHLWIVVSILNDALVTYSRDERVPHRWTVRDNIQEQTMSEGRMAGSIANIWAYQIRRGATVAFAPIPRR